MSRKPFNKEPDRGTATCDVCGKRFELNMNGHYVARDNTKTGISTIASHEEPTLYDAIDCPHCGRQKLVGIRLRRLEPEMGLREEEDNE